ncbi:MAG: hypothetical protein WB800_18340, partial [Streptosporangiaceae bacterium]
MAKRLICGAMVPGHAAGTEAARAVVHRSAARPAGVAFRGRSGAEAAGGPKGTVVRVMGPFLAIEAAMPAVSTPSA